MPNQGFLGWSTVPAPAAPAASSFQYTRIRGTGNKTTTSATFVVIDGTNLPPLSLTLFIGDIVRCTLMAQAAIGAGTMPIDFQVVQPSLGTTRTNPTATNGTISWGSTNRTPLNAVTLFFPSEAGVHTFQPIWLTTSGTATMYNATSGSTDDTPILFMVERLH